MASNKRRRQRKTGGFSIASFVAGIVVGCLASILIAATAVPVLDSYQPDTAAFPDIRQTSAEYEYEFPDLLEARDARQTSTKPLLELVVVPQRPANVAESSDTSNIESFLLQAGSFEQQRHADVFRASLMLRGYQAKTTVIEIGEGDLRYRVVVGPYPSRVEAQAAIDRLKTEEVEALLLGIREN
ncbi:MAG: hypothetical protein F4W90_06400 [Gammaproteobacteria bacterium]|nr:hypothetical protein [Gammaproteobacteria bacterium]